MVKVWLRLDRKITRQSLGKITVIGENYIWLKLPPKNSDILLKHVTIFTLFVLWGLSLLHFKQEAQFYCAFAVKLETIMNFFDSRDTD